jgi:cytochrome c553
MKTLFATAALALSLLAAPALADDTADLWKAKCRSCHGADGKADTKEGKKNKIDDMSTAEWQAKHSDEEIQKTIAGGVPDTKMKAYKETLSAEEIAALVKHIRTFKK